MKKLGLLISISLIIGIFSCKDGEDLEPDYGTKADLLGSVILFDEGSHELPNDSMIVSIIGSHPSISDTTDADGNFVFKDVNYGTYSISYSKNGFGFFTLNHVYHQKGETIISTIPQLGQYSSTHITQLTANVGGSNISIFATTDPNASNGNMRYLRFFFSASDNVSSIHYDGFSSIVIAQMNPFEYKLNLHKLIDMGFNSGDKIWVKAYGESLHSNDYIDLITGNHIFPNLNLHSAAAVSFIMP